MAKQKAASSKAKSEAEKAKQALAQLSTADELVNDKSLLSGEAVVVDQHLKDLLRLRKKLRAFLVIAEDCLLALGEQKKVNAFDLQRASYTVIGLYNQYREVMADIRSIEDHNQYAGQVHENVIVPMGDDIFQNFVDALVLIQSLIKSHIEPKQMAKVKDKFDHYMMEHGKYIREAVAQARTRTDAMFAQE